MECSTMTLNATFLTILFLSCILSFNWLYCYSTEFSKTTSILSQRAGKDRLLQQFQSILTGKDSTFKTNPSLFVGVNPRKLVGIRIEKNGVINQFEIAKQTLANELKLPLRDLRIIDPSYPSQIQATIVARPNVILFSVDHLKIVIKNNEALIFNANHEEVKRYIPLLQQQLLSQGSSSMSESFHSLSTQNVTASEELVNEEYPLSIAQQRFEHIVLETALNLICFTLSTAIKALEPAVAAALLDLRAVSRGLDVIQTQVDELLPLKNRIDELRQRCIEIKQCILDVLNSDEDMEMMFLEEINIFNRTRSPIASVPFKSTFSSLKFPRSKNEFPHSSNRRKKSSWKPILQKNRRKERRNTMTLEILLENYLNEVEWVTSEVDDILNEITNTEENVVLQLDLIRNRILKFELYLSISSFIVTCGALMTGLFGMNLLNHFETNRHMFYLVTGVLFSSMIIGFRSFMKFAKKQKLL